MDGRQRSRWRNRPIRITDAPRSPEQELRSRRGIYAVLMVIHLSGLVAAGLLYQHWILALVILVCTGALPWVAVVVANDRRAPERPARRGRSGRPAEHGRPLDEADRDQFPGLPGPHYDNPG